MVKEENETKCSSGLGIALWKTEPRSVEDVGQIYKIWLGNNFEITGKSDLVAEFKEGREFGFLGYLREFKRMRMGS